MQRLNAYDESSLSTVKVVTTVMPKPTSTSTITPAKPSFFTGWMAVPPSLAGRPKLSQEQEDYIRREYERGPVPLMWAKNEDIENQASIVATTNAAPAPASTSWFGNWGFRSNSTFSSAAVAAAATTVTAPLRAAVAPIASDSGRREASQAL
ncbi:hypothetical protein BGW39_002303 [Mortierella sp. 14UC]|nr:hypothetical protein BGW39_002303 [Mortierella sp. 14UC]